MCCSHKTLLHTVYLHLSAFNQPETNSGLYLLTSSGSKVKCFFEIIFCSFPLGIVNQDFVFFSVKHTDLPCNEMWYV